MWLRIVNYCDAVLLLPKNINSQVFVVFSDLFSARCLRLCRYFFVLKPCCFFQRNWSFDNVSMYTSLSIQSSEGFIFRRLLVTLSNTILSCRPAAMSISSSDCASDPFHCGRPFLVSKCWWWVILQCNLQDLLICCCSAHVAAHDFSQTSQAPHKSIWILHSSLLEPKCPTTHALCSCRAHGLFIQWKSSCWELIK